MACRISLPLLPVATAVGSLLLAGNPAQAITGFTGPYAPGNWTTAAQNGGIVSLSTDDTLQLRIPANGSQSAVVYQITMPDTGQVSFDWSVSGVDGFSFWQANISTGSGQQILGNSSNPIISGNKVTGVLQAGATFDFLLRGSSSGSEPATLTITNFNAPPVPGPLPVLGAAAAFGWSRRLRRRVAAGTRYSTAPVTPLFR